MFVVCFIVYLLIEVIENPQDISNGFYDFLINSLVLAHPPPNGLFTEKHPNRDLPLAGLSLFIPIYKSLGNSGNDGEFGVSSTLFPQFPKIPKDIKRDSFPPKTQE